MHIKRDPIYRLDIPDLALHDDAAYLAHDIYGVTHTATGWGPQGYARNADSIAVFNGQNFAPALEGARAKAYAHGEILTLVDYAVVISPRIGAAMLRLSPSLSTVRAGEVFVLAGLVGSGRSSLLGALFGAVRTTAGRVRVGPVWGPFADPRSAMAAGVASLPEDRKAAGLLLERSVRENVTLASLETVSRAGVLDARRERARAAALCEDLRVKTPGLEVPVQTLSGGNQQKVMLARWMARPHRVVLLDEPTRGVDVGAKSEIHALVERLAAGGAAVVVATSELPEAIALGDRIGVMHAGRLAGILDNSRRAVTQEAILHLATGAA